MKYSTIINKYEEYQEKDNLNILLSKLIKKSSEYSTKQKEKNFIIDIITKDNKYSSYIEFMIYEIENYKSYCNNRYDDDDIEALIKYLCSDDIDVIIGEFIKSGYPCIKLESVIDKVGDIFEKVIGEKKGYLKDKNGVWHKFGDDNEKYTELLGLKYPIFKYNICDNNEYREKFIELLDDLTDKYTVYEYNELELIDIEYF